MFSPKLAPAAAPAAAAGEPMVICVDGLSLTEATPAFSTESRIEPEKRRKKWRLTSPVMPPRPSSSPPGEPIWMETPSGRITRVQITKARDWPSETADLYWPISRLPRGISTCLPSKLRTSRLTTARV
jgi:hypothetical protein